jgi:recombination protein RecA
MPEFDIMYGEGVHKEVLDLAVEFEIIKKSGSWVSVTVETKLGKSLCGEIKSRTELADELS